MLKQREQVERQKQYDREDLALMRMEYENGVVRAFHIQLGLPAWMLELDAAKT